MEITLSVLPGLLLTQFAINRPRFNATTFTTIFLPELNVLFVKMCFTLNNTILVLVSGDFCTDVIMKWNDVTDISE